MRSMLRTIMLMTPLLLGGVAMAEDQFQAPPMPANLDQLGRNIQRTMTLLATSTPEKRNRVRILFYGQSVTAGAWSHALADDLRKQYPHADLVIENRAIGGYGAESLLRTADYDLYPFYPDLLVYHCWGGVKTGEQEEIIKRVRQRTTSEILLWTTHFRFNPKVPKETPLDDPAVIGQTRDDEERVALWKQLAPKYGCEIAEVREPLRAYLKEHNLYPQDTLADSVHPNALGHFLIRSLIKPYLRYDPKFTQEPWKNLVTEIPLNDVRVQCSEKDWCRLPFDGNKIELIAQPTDQQVTTAKVLIDGKAPSQFPELYYHSRPTAAPNVWWPSINKIGSEKPLALETWTLKISECDVEKKVLKFSLSGSVTGPDGEGDASQRFVSDSGRVVIEPRDWSVINALSYSKKPLPAGYVITWETRPLFVDIYQPPATPEKSREYATTLAQGLSNGPHVLELIPEGNGAVPIKSFKVYKPPLQ